MLIQKDVLDVIRVDEEVSVERAEEAEEDNIAAARPAFDEGSQRIAPEPRDTAEQGAGGAVGARRPDAALAVGALSTFPSPQIPGGARRLVQLGAARLTSQSRSKYLSVIHSESLCGRACLSTGAHRSKAGPML